MSAVLPQLGSTIESLAARRRSTEAYGVDALGTKRQTEYETLAKSATLNSQSPLSSPPHIFTPRHVHLRSRVIMQRTDQGVYSVLPPADLLAAGSLCEPSWSSNCGIKLMKTTHYAGDSTTLVPVELVSKGSDPMHRLPRREKVRGRVMAAMADGEPGGVRTRRCLPPLELSSDLQNEMKTRLNNLMGSNLKTDNRVSDFQKNPRTLRLFVKELQEIANSLKMPLTEKRYRKGYTYKMLHSLLQQTQYAEVLSPEVPDVGELPLSGLLTFTILITLFDIPWVFTYNSRTHRLCNCRASFPGSACCLTPVEGMSEGALADDHAPGITAGPKSLIDRIEALRQRERHFPARLMDLSRTLRKRVTEFCLLIPGFLSDVNGIPLSGPDKQQKWARFFTSFSTEVCALDLYYMRFEEFYLGLLDKMLSTALEPVRGMSGPSSSLVSVRGDPFRPVETALLCQRLGLLKQQVKFGGLHNIVHFDSQLLVKAQRVRHMDTYEEVRNMAAAMLASFDGLCEVLKNLDTDQIHPELSENADLREKVVRLEEVWAECQFILQQGVLDFIEHLLKFLPQINHTCRWKLRVAMLSDVSGISEEDQKQARQMLFETLPIIIYLDELRRDIRLSEDGKESTSHFRDLFCPKNDRHHMLRRDFAKFDESKFEKFRKFLLGEKDEEIEGEGLHAKYFQNMHKQLKEVAAFASHQSPTAALQAATCLEAAEAADVQKQAENDEQRFHASQNYKIAAEARARWVCVQRVAQSVQPDLFPQKKSLPPSPRNASNRRNSSNAAARSSRRTSFENCLDDIEESDVTSPISPTASTSSRRTTLTWVEAQKLASAEAKKSPRDRRSSRRVSRRLSNVPLSKADLEAAKQKASK